MVASTTGRFALVALACSLLFAGSCRRPGRPARELVEMVVEVVREGEVDRLTEHGFKVAQMVLYEPVWDGDAPGFDRDNILARKQGYREAFHMRTIRDWLRQHHEPGSDLEIAVVYEFASLADMTGFLGVDPELAGIPVVDEVAKMYPEHEPQWWPAERVQFISRMAPIHLSAELWPLIARHKEEGTFWTGLTVLEESGLCDRWAVGYVASRRLVYGFLMLRVRGLWALWPLVR